MPTEVTRFSARFAALRGSWPIATTFLMLCVGCSAPSPANDPAAVPTNQTLDVAVMSLASPAANDLQIELGGDQGAGWFGGGVRPAFSDQGSINLLPFAVSETQLPDNTVGAIGGKFAYVTPDDVSGFERLAFYIAGRHRALFLSEGWGLLYIAHGMNSNPLCSGITGGMSVWAVNQRVAVKEQRWTIVFADDISNHVNNCYSAPRPRFKRLFSYIATHELGHQLAGLSHPDGPGGYPIYHQQITWSLPNGGSRQDVMTYNFGNLIPDIVAGYDVPLFCFRSSSRRDPVASGSPVQNSCSGNLFRYRAAP